MNEERELILDVAKKYEFPIHLCRKYIANNILIISSENANWLLLHNKNQEEIFDQLVNNTIEFVLHNLSDLDSEDFFHVLTEIEAKQFTSVKNKPIGFNNLNLYLTNRCNLRCKHCYMFAGKAVEDELTTKEIIKLLNDFNDYGGKNIVLTGGEITERKDLKEIIQFINKLGLVCTLLSNGTNWSDELISFVSDKISEVQISIDGYDEDSNARVRGMGQFQLALDTVNRFYNKGVRVTVAITPIYPIDRDKYIEFGNWLQNKFNNHIFNVKFTYEMLNGRDSKITDIDNEIYHKTISEIVNAISPENQIEKFSINHNNNKLFSNCGYGSLTVAANGDVFCCNRIHDLKSYGNIRSMNFRDVIASNQSIHELSDVDNLIPCKDCEIRYICGGGCRIDYVPELMKTDPFIKTSFQRIGCTEAYKEEFYNKMIEANHLFYR